jgi:isopenicillin N synthase-like dioxygenase
MMRNIYLSLSLVFTSFFHNCYSESDFHASIPVIDMKLYDDQETREEFILRFAEALHEIGFCAIINSGVDEEILENGYTASQKFFKSPKEKKLEIHAPHLNGQRGIVFSENAQGEALVDHKEFIHIGKSDNLWPTWMDLEHPMLDFISHLEVYSNKLQSALSLFMGQDENYLQDMTEGGTSLLRALYYPKNPSPGQFWAAEHTDIDLFTILPMATEEGLQLLHNGNWIDIKVPPHAFIINCGDMLENISNGYFKSSVHRVISKPNLERFSIVYFVHPKYTDRLDPLDYCINLTGGIRRFPYTSHLEMLAHRLVEIGIASDDLIAFDKDSGYIDRIESLVNKGIASDPVLKTYQVWKQRQG